MTPAQRAFDVAHRKQQAAMKKYFALREKRDNSQYPSTRWDSFDRKATAQLRHVSRLGNEEDKILESIGGISALINPQASAERMYESFHGKPAEGETIIEEEFHEHEYLAPLGVLVNFKVATLSGFDDLIGTDDATAERQDYDETAANADTIFLAVNEDGTQLYFRGGDQSLPLEKFKMGESTDWYRDDMIVGVLYEITYRTKKKFDKFKLTDYYHQLGEETGDQPMLRYDPLSPHLYVSGGKYKIKMPLIGVSPGIEN